MMNLKKGLKFNFCEKVVNAVLSSAMMFLSQMTLSCHLKVNLLMVNFLTEIPDQNSHSPALSDLFLYPNFSICSTIAFPPVGNSDHVVVSVSIYSEGNTPFHCIAYDYSCADWNGLHDTLNFMDPFYGWASTVSMLQSHYEEAVYFLQLSPQKFLVLI